MTMPVRRNRYPGRRWDALAGLPGFDDLFDQMSRMLTTAFPDVATPNPRALHQQEVVRQTAIRNHLAATARSRIAVRLRMAVGPAVTLSRWAVI